VRRLLVVLLGFAVGIGAGGAIGLAARGDGSHRDGLTESPHTLPAAPVPPRREPVVPDTMLAWTAGGLPDGFAARVSSLRGVTRGVSVVSGTAWLTETLSGDGTPVERAPEGLAIPLDVGGAGLRAYAPFLPPADRAELPDLARGDGVLGAASAELRHLGPGDLLRFGSPSRTVRIAAILPDTLIGAHELFVSRATAAALGVTRERYVLIDPDPGVRQQALAGRIRAAAPSGIPVRIRGPNQTTYFRQGDAVLPPVILKRDFGEFAARPAPGGFLDIDPRWEATHIVRAHVPILGWVRCNRGVMPQLRGALSELQRHGLSHLIDPADYAGCYVPKFLRNDPSSGVSHHAWGIAVDLNVSENPFGHTPHQDPRLVSVFERWGFIWGGRFLVPDGMHFEFVRFTSGG
jgi:hypothetical protein